MTSYYRFRGARRVRWLSGRVGNAVISRDYYYHDVRDYMRKRRLHFQPARRASGLPPAPTLTPAK